MNEWWRGTVMYQVYPRSFLDTHQDGIGDLAGIVDRLEYIARLGVDMVWISPFFPSPMKDFGYDVTDYKNVDPIFGTLDDFKRLTERARSLGLKVMIDLVLSHTSDQHPWFFESRSSRNNSKADWYVWADPKPDGTPPNNWLSIFGGSAWEWDATRQQFYMHNFLTSQPDLNYHNPEVVEEMMGVAEFWLNLGVNGFRLDTCNWYFHDQELRNNPPNQGGLLPYAAETSNYHMQEHIYNKTRPEVLYFLEHLRRLVNKYNGITLGELTAKNALELTPLYTEQEKRLHMVYTFAMLTRDYSAAHIKKTIDTIDRTLGSGWICWAFSNHDVVRTVSRWRDESVPMEMQAKCFLTLLMSLRGSVCIYQGEELGLPEVDIAFEDIQDPYGKRLWPEFKGRDGCRTPMPWHMNMPHGGFTSVNARPWLPIPMTHLEKAVDVQEMDEASVLHFTRKIIAFRKQHPALCCGTVRLLDIADPIVAFERDYEEERLIIALNISNQPQSFELPEEYAEAKEIQPALFETEQTERIVTLPAYHAYIGKL